MKTAAGPSPQKISVRGVMRPLVRDEIRLVDFFFLRLRLGQVLLRLAFDDLLPKNRRGRPLLHVEQRQGKQSKAPYGLAIAG